MAYEMRDGGGTIFKNKYKEDGDTKPHYKGDVMWRGEKVEIALWVKEGANGKFFSVKLQEPREKPEQLREPITRPEPPTKPTARKSSADMDGDEVPF